MKRTPIHTDSTRGFGVGYNGCRSRQRGRLFNGQVRLDGQDTRQHPAGGPGKVSPSARPPPPLPLPPPDARTKGQQ